MLEEAVIRRVLSSALRTGGDFAEIFVEDRRASSGRLDDGKVEELSSSRSKGAGIRVISGDTTGFAHTSDLTETSLRTAAEAAAAAAKGGGDRDRTVDLERQIVPHLVEVRSAPEDVAKATKVQLLQRANSAARGEGAAVKQVTASYADGRRRILVANTDGLLAEDDQVRTRFGVQCVAVADTGMQTGMKSVGRTVGFEMFDDVDVEELAAEAARQAVRKLQARPAPSGTLPVVIKAGGGAVLFHEACGHPLEADIIGKGASVFCNRIGEKVASEHVTLVDDASVAGEWGYFTIDDEGKAPERSVLIENGILTDYMWDFLRARKEGRQSSGNGRRQTYRHLPMVRMTNTYLENGNEDPDEIIRQTERGVYIAQLGGGQVNPASGDFVFGMTEAYMIENGELTYPIRDANIIGSGADVLAKIDAIGNDFAMAPGGGMCGKDAQSAPVGMGQPTLRVSAMTIGGTASA